MSATVRRLLIAFAVLGLAASSAASWVHYRLIKNPDYTSFCDVNATVSCKEAYLSPYGSIGGVPVAVLGLLFFGLVLILVWVGTRTDREAGSGRRQPSAPLDRGARDGGLPGGRVLLRARTGLSALPGHIRGGHRPLRDVRARHAPDVGAPGTRDRRNAQPGLDAGRDGRDDAVRDWRGRVDCGVSEAGTTALRAAAPTTG